MTLAAEGASHVASAADADARSDGATSDEASSSEAARDDASADAARRDAIVREARALADAACAEAGIALEVVRDPERTRVVADVLGAVWGPSDSSIVDPAALVAIAHAGNLVAIAADDGVPVGAAVGFCGPPGTAYHSHIVGFLPHAVGAGRGRALKLAQRAWCLEQGIDRMTWTFDPLVARNARFNVRTLGARLGPYLPDFYGAMTDAVNQGQHSDRLLVRWDLLQAPPARDAVEAAAPANAHRAIELDGTAPTPYLPPPAVARHATVALPADLAALRRDEPEVARRWRLEVRAALVDLLADGWSVEGVARSGHYDLTRHTMRETDR